MCDVLLSCVRKKICKSMEIIAKVMVLGGEKGLVYMCGPWGWDVIVACVRV